MTLPSLQGRSRTNAVLSALCVTLLLVTGEELLSPEEQIGAAAPDSTPYNRPTDPSQLRFAMPSASALSEVIARPVFSPTRRPAPQGAAVAASAAFSLVGVVIAPGERRALLGFGQPRKIARVAEGEEISGWTVEAILPEKVIVRRADLREEVSAKRNAVPDQQGAGPRMPAAAVFAGRRAGPSVPRRAHDE